MYLIDADNKPVEMPFFTPAGFSWLFVIATLFRFSSSFDREMVHIYPSKVSQTDPVNCTILGMPKKYTCTTGETKLQIHDKDHDVFDSRNKIVISWMPKSACSYVMQLLAYQLGVIYHSESPHTFRMEWYGRCSPELKSCVYLDPSWYKFKVIRNPYDRMVSSYLYSMVTAFIPDKILRATIPGIVRRHDISFTRFLEYAENVVAQGYKIDNHVKAQHKPWEWEYFLEGKPTLYNKIVKIENLEQDLDEVRKATGIDYPTSFKETPSHYAVRRNVSNFVGDVPYGRLRNKIPTDYGHFYNDELKERVGKLMERDLLVYNYSFPFGTF